MPRLLTVEEVNLRLKERGSPFQLMDYYGMHLNAVCVHMESGKWGYSWPAHILNGNIPKWFTTARGPYGPRKSTNVDDG